MQKFYLLGELKIEDDGHESKLLQSPKGCALISYLIVTQKPRPTPSNILLNLLFLKKTGQKPKLF